MSICRASSARTVGLGVACVLSAAWCCRSWLSQLHVGLGTPGEACPPSLHPAVEEYIWGLFEEHLDKGLAFVHSQACKEIIPSVAINNAASTTAIFEVGLACWFYAGHVACFYLCACTLPQRR